MLPTEVVYIIVDKVLGVWLRDIVYNPKQQDSHVIVTLAQINRQWRHCVQHRVNGLWDQQISGEEVL